MDSNVDDVLPLTRRVMGGVPATTLDDAVKLCNPAVALDPEADAGLHVNLDVLRGGDRMATLIRAIRRQGSTSSLQFLTGHIGSGKTTELLRMGNRLSKLPFDHRPTVLVLDATPLVEISDVDLEDILVALWKLVADRSTPAAAAVLAEIWKKELRDAIVSQATGASGLLRSVVDKLPSVATEGLSKLLDVLKLQPPEQRKALRMLLSNLTDTLVHGLNRALEVVREAAAGPVVLLIDNLEKLSSRQREAVEHLYLERLRALSRLDAHLVITAPSFLVYSSGGAGLLGQYATEVVVLPMVRVRGTAEGGHARDDQGIDLLVRVLTQRVDFARLFDGGVETAEAIVLATGGCIRHALAVVASAINQQDDAPIARTSVDRALGQFEAGLMRALDDEWLPALRKVHETNRFPSDCKADARREMLRNLFVLEYQRGQSEETFFEVHPLVVRSRRFREAT
ncbi:MAG: hypothetical protein Q8S73_10170 [Deltaproteobacteria bacterium]|nr:hypothetical protein [Myxococcales bacterium]MDP3214459.1 hypothetical protein [Deltaproteobacteria bacterium]